MRSIPLRPLQTLPENSQERQWNSDITPRVPPQKFFYRLFQKLFWRFIRKLSSAIALEIPLRVPTEFHNLFWITSNNWFRLGILLDSYQILSELYPGNPSEMFLVNYSDNFLLKFSQSISEYLPMFPIICLYYPLLALAIFKHTEKIL